MKIVHDKEVDDIQKLETKYFFLFETKFDILPKQAQWMQSVIG